MYLPSNHLKRADEGSWEQVLSCLAAGRMECNPSEGHLAINSKALKLHKPKFYCYDILKKETETGSCSSSNRLSRIPVLGLRASWAAPSVSLPAQGTN